MQDGLIFISLLCIQFINDLINFLVISEFSIIFISYYPFLIYLEVSIVSLKMFEAFYKNKTILVTGHTGFKGGWLSEWLLMLGAKVVGVSLEPNTNPSLFKQLQLKDRIEHHILDIRDREKLKSLFLSVKPDYVFHLAAQPLVRLSYDNPVKTYETNVMGTVHILDAMRALDDCYQKNGRFCSSVFITSDKCYENREWLFGYKENDSLGGYDPYSSSKGAAEIAISSFRRSFLNPEDKKSLRIGVSSARAGNVIGGGDWALDRIIPDCIRALKQSKSIAVRNTIATRPWQHVLEPLSGYLLLAGKQMDGLVSGDRESLSYLSSAFNFGPSLSSNRSVKDLVEEVVKIWPGEWEDKSDPNELHEAGKLNLVWDKAFHLLGWQPRWEFKETIQKTINWYKESIYSSSDIKSLVRADIIDYSS